MKPVALERLKTLALLLIILLVFATIYTTLHEGGHALVGLAFGGRITAFNINFFDLSAHAGIEGTFTSARNAAINVAGASLPLLVWVLVMLLLPRQGGFVVQWIKLVATLGTLNTLLAWVILPFLYLNGTAPAYDDVTQFITNSGLPPLAVAGGSLVLYALGWVLFALRIGDLRLTFNRLRENDAPLPGWKRAVIVGIVIAVAIGGFSLVAKTLNRQDPNLPPDGYKLVASIPLAGRSYQSETIYHYIARAGQLAGVYVRVTNINTAYIDLNLIGADGTSYLLLHGEGLFTSVSASRGNYGLPAGEARLVLTSQVSPGLLEIYIEEP